MRLQSLALATAMGWTPPYSNDVSAPDVSAPDVSAAAHNVPRFRDIIVTPRQPLRSLPRLGQLAMLAPFLPISTPSLPFDEAGFPDILVTCGRRMAGLSIAVRQRARAAGYPIKTIHIQDPRLDPSCFDILLVPAHDPARGANVIVSTGSLNRLTMATIADAASALDRKWANAAYPRVVVMLGGDNRRYRISSAMASHMATQLTAFAAQTKASLLLVPSRRTPPELLRQLTAILALDDKYVRHRIVTAQDINPYPGILGIADAIIVTADSVNMASEAAITGTPVMIAAWHNKTGHHKTGHNKTGQIETAQIETGRLAAFHDAMIRGGHTVPLGDTIPTHEFIPLDEMPMICARVKTLLARD